MGVIPDDIKSGLQNLAKASKKDVKILVNELKEIIASDETIKAMPPEQEEFKIRYAWAVLCRRHTASGQTSQVYIKALSKPRYGKTKAGKGRLDLFAMVKRVTKDADENDIIGEVELGAGTLWEKAAEAAQKISKDKVYKVSLKTIEAKSQVSETLITGLELSANDAVFVETTETTFPSNKEFYTSFIEPKEKDIKIDLDELDLHRKTSRIDIRVFKAMIVDYRVGVSAVSNREYGQYIVTDDSLLGGGLMGEDKENEKPGKPGDFMFYLDPADVEMEKGVVMKYVGTVNYNKNKDKDGWDFFFAIPVGTAVKRKIETKPVEKETEDVDLNELEEPNVQDVVETTDDDFAV